MKWGKRMMAAGMAVTIGCGLLGHPSMAANDNQKNVAVAKEIVGKMSLEEKIGQMLMPAMRTWNGADVTVLPEELSEAISRYKFGGIILFAPNTVGTEQTIKLIDQMQQASEYPLLISIDQEGGTVTRLGSGTNFGGNMALTATGDIQDTVAVSNAIGQELDALGIQIDFGPVMDVNVNPANPIIGVRSFSDDPNVVARQGSAYIQGLHKANVISALKHFPGHGDTNTDSHTGLPRIDKSLAQLMQCELIPFKAGIDAGTDMVMTAHIEYPQIEKTSYKAKNGQTITLPATLSKTIISDILRGQLGFQGVVTTDALNMDAIAKLFDPRDSAKLAINADVDILLMPVDLSTKTGIQNMEKYINDIVDMVAKGEIDGANITRSAERIVKLKLDYGIMKEDGSVAGSLLQQEDMRIAKALQVVGSAEHKALEWNVARKSVTLVKNDNSVLPLNQTEARTVAILCPYNSEVNLVNGTIAKLKQDSMLLNGTTCQAYSYEKKKITELEMELKDKDTFIVISEMSGLATINPKHEKGWQSVFIDGLNQMADRQGKKVILISAQLPYDAARYQEADSILLTYCAKNTAASIPAAVYSVFDKGLPTGQIPVAISNISQ